MQAGQACVTNSELPIKVDWLDAPLVLKDLTKAIWVILFDIALEQV